MADSNDPDLKERARQFAEGLAQAAGLDVQARVVSEEEEAITIAFDGEDARWFVGRHGQALDALQYLASLAVNKRSGQRIRIILDADSYRERREKVLTSMAEDLAAQVKSSGEEAVLDPLSPMERRIVHNALLDDPGVKTYSEGEEPNRFVIISPAS